eukprot:UN03770
MDMGSMVHDQTITTGHMCGNIDPITIGCDPFCSSFVYIHLGILSVDDCNCLFGVLCINFIFMLCNLLYVRRRPRKIDFSRFRKSRKSTRRSQSIIAVTTTTTRNDRLITGISSPTWWLGICSGGDILCRCMEF